MDSLTEQYRDSSNLSARVRLHERFSTNHCGWHRWVFDQLEMPNSGRILELGCGPGLLWQQNVDRLQPGCDVVLSDRSAGMLAEARSALKDVAARFSFLCVDAQRIPYPNSSFDVVVANHMLYHVPDRPSAFAEICRVLRPSGRLYAATNGTAHLREIGELVRQATPEWATWAGAVGSSNLFSLENGAEQMMPWFPHVELTRYEDALVVTEREPLLDYILSGSAYLRLDDGRVARVARRIDKQLASTGAIRITKDSGMFVGSMRHPVGLPADITGPAAH